MTPQKTFNKEIDAMNLTDLQKLEIKIAATALEGSAWREGFKRNQEITAQTLSILQ